MADFTQIIQEINDDINTNGVGAITGAKLNEVLRDIVAAVNAAKADILPDGSVFGGFALPDTPPTYGDNHQFYYIAEQSGTYEYYNNIQLDGRFFTMLFWNGLQWDYFMLSYTPNGLGGELQNYLRKDNLYQRLGFSLFSPNETYHAGDVTVYNGVLYQFNNDHTGAWTGNDVDQTDLFTIMWNNFDDAFFMINDLGNNKADPIPVVDASTIPASMDADKVYQYGTLSGDTTFPPLATPTEPDIANVYCWTFTTPATAPTITWPSAITSWAGGSAPTINASKSYEVSVMDGFATIIEN